ncbi:MAG: hypothetical protein JW712_06950 [Dehalococcoidales bacterium]|nr:hypothetical protein [Dehalococcoidales bacterium]
MAKQFILYKLADHVTDEEYEKYVVNEKGPLLDSLSSVKKFELVRTVDTPDGPAPYRYVGIMHITSMEDFAKNDAPSQAFQDFMARWQPMVSEVQMLSGEEIY